MSEKQLICAIPKGRMMEPVVEILQRAQLFKNTSVLNSRSLYLKDGNIVFMPLKPRDIPVFVEKGAADLGVIGEDLLREMEPDVDIILNLNIGLAWFVFAAPENTPFPPLSGYMRVATKYPRITEKILHSQSLRGEIITLYGSTEVAPRAGLSEYIADLMSTGATLRENNLVVVKKWFPVTSYLCANRASLRVKYSAVKEIICRLKKVIK